MRILVTSTAAAAVLMFAGLGLFFLNYTPALALGDVIKAAEKHKLVRYKENQTTDDKANGLGTLDTIVYADLKAPRTRRESRIKYPDGEAVLVDVCTSDRHLMTNSREKTAWLALGNKGYKSFVGGFQEWQQKKGVTFGKDKLDGRETVRYRHEEGGNTTLLWVDATTKLLVRYEYELIDPNPNISRIRIVWTDFEWDPALPKGFQNGDELFSTRPPEGYTLDDQTKKEK